MLKDFIILINLKGEKMEYKQAIKHLKKSKIEGLKNLEKQKENFLNLQDKKLKEIRNKIDNIRIN